MDNLKYIGFISGPFGLKGEVKIISDTNLPEKVFKKGNNLYIDDKPYKIVNYHIHKNNHLVTFDGFDDINKLDNLLKKDIYINLDELKLPDNEYLYSEIIGYKIIDNFKEVGIVEEILLTKKDFYIKSGDLIVPMIHKYLLNVDKKNHVINVVNTKELIL